MNNKKLLIILLLSLFALTFVLRAEDLPVEKSETYKVKKGDRVAINLSSGEIQFKTWGRDEVMVQIVNFDKDENNYIAHQSGSSLQINYNASWAWDDDNNFVVTVPTGLFITARTGSGEIRVEDDLEGNIVFSTSSGDIITRMVKGNVDLKTSGGDIICGNITGNLNAISMGGDILVADVNGNCNLDTKGGDIRTKKISGKLSTVTYGGDIIIDNARDNLMATTYGGDIKIESAENNAKVISYAGDILIGKGVGQINVEASAGDIVLKDGVGSVNLTALSGDISASFAPKDHSVLRSNYGDISISIPSDSKVRINATAKTAFDDNDLIVSDFESFVKESISKNGRAKKEYSINGGGNAIIEIKTNNAKIFIKKK